MQFKKLIFVSGKGGTGKTTMALLLARYLARQKKRVLFVELTNKSSAQALLEEERGPVGVPSSTSFGFDWCLLQGRDCLIEYVSSIIKVKKIAQSFFENSFVSSLLNVAPGLNDLALLGKLTSQVRQHGPGFDYDHIVIDSPSTGTFLSFLSAPSILGESVKVGPLHRQSRDIDQVLKDKGSVQYLFVSQFEELPVDELEETVKNFSKFRGQLRIVMNKKFPLGKTNIKDPSWSSYVKNRLREQSRQSQRVSLFGVDAYSQDLFTQGFKEYLLDSNEEFLRNL